MTGWGPLPVPRVHPRCWIDPWGGGMVTTILLAVNLAFFAVQLVEGSSGIEQQGVLYGPYVADGEIWRLVSAAFLHADLIHIAFNMVMLWWLGSALERYAGSPRMATIYGAAVMWGSAGVLIHSPDAPTLGASGGVFGLMGAVLWIELRERQQILGGSIWVLLAINLALTFYLPQVSVGGHIGGLVGGALCAVLIAEGGRRSLARVQSGWFALALGLVWLVAGVVVGVSVV